MGELAPAAPDAPRAARHPWLAGRRTKVLMGAAALAAAGGLLASTFSLLNLQNEAARCLNAEVTLAQARTAIDTYRGVAVGFISGIDPTLARQADLAAGRAAAARLLATAASQSSDTRGLVALEARLDVRIRRELALAAAHRWRAASQYDAAVVRPAYLRLLDHLDRDSATLARRAAATRSAATHRVITLLFIRAGVALAGLVLLDATRRRQLRRRLDAEAERRTSERVAALVRHATDLLTVIGPDGRVRFEAPSTADLLRYEPGTLAGRRFADLVHPEDRVLLQLLCEAGGSQQADLRLTDAAGTFRTFAVRATRMLDHPEVGGIVLNARDVTDHRLLEAELHHQSLHDALTGLPNRSLFRNRLEHTLARRHPPGAPVAVCVLDLDDFRAINESLGHGTGDAVLSEVARRLSRAARAGDTVARLGGDTFGVLVDEPVDQRTAMAVARRLLAVLEPPVELDNGTFALQASCGLAVPGADGDSAEALIRNAEVAMYVAKRDGDGLLVAYEQGMHAAVVERLDLVHDLQGALAAGDQLEVHYQPIVRLATGEPVGVEALVRWRHPYRGLIPPPAFIPLAEDTGLIVALGRTVLRQATAQVARWQADHAGLAGLSVSVNASARQLADVGFVDDVRAALALSGLDPSCLVVEITESVFLGDEVVVKDRLADLKALGVRLAIDDFGTGYSSLGYLKRYPIDVMKVDLSFTADLTRGGRGAALAEAVVRMGAALQLEIVAEGVEDPRQAELLRGLDCELGQGFLYARPLPPDDCERQLLRGGAPLIPAG